MANLWLEVRDAVNLKKVRHFPPRAPDHQTTKVEKYSSNTQSTQTRKVQNSNLFSYWESPLTFILIPVRAFYSQKEKYFIGAQFFWIIQFFQYIIAQK